MKAKMKLRHFWRNNKKHVGMYFALFNTAFAILTMFLGDCLIAMYDIASVVLWSIIWQQDRQIDIIRRCVVVDDHNIGKHIESVRKRAFSAGWNAAMSNKNKQA